MRGSTTGFKEVVESMHYLCRDIGAASLYPTGQNINSIISTECNIFEGMRKNELKRKLKLYKDGVGTQKELFSSFDEYFNKKAFMKIILHFDCSEIDHAGSYEDFSGSIDWLLPFLPRIGEQFFTDNLLFDGKRDYADNVPWNVWSVDYKSGEFGVTPHIWLQAAY